MPNSKGRRRRFGAVRELRSGQWQARYRGPDGVMRPADRTFPDKTTAEQWLTTKEAEILTGDWLDPDAGCVPFGGYAQAWIDERPGLRPKTLQLYRYLLRRHLVPGLGGMAVAEIREPQVRRWRKGLLDAEVSEVTVAKAYRLLKAIMNTAVDDGLIRRNPCRIKGASQETSPERPVLTVAQVYALADAIDPQYRTLVLLATFGSLRWGELAALRRKDIDLSARTIRVERQLTEITGQGLTFGPPKSAAGHRAVPLPGMILTDLIDHLSQHVQAGNDALIFTSPEGTPLRHGNFTRRAWQPAIKETGMSGVHFHDLRHAGNTYTANAGANLRELMERMGHATSRAAMIYLHSTDQRQRILADAVDKAARAELRQARKWPPKIKKPAQGNDASGTEVARDREPDS
jgi:integrase